MDLKHTKRIVDCLTPRDPLGLWGLEAVAKQLGMESVALEAREAADHLFAINQKMLELSRERDAIIDRTVSIRPMILTEIEHRLQNLQSECNGYKRCCE